MPRIDPTQTYTLREKEFRPALTTRFRALKGAVRTTVGYKNDALRLKQLTAGVDDIEPKETFTFRTDRGAVGAFIRWLRRMLRTGVLEALPQNRVERGEHYTGPYVRAAASRGWQNAGRQLESAGVEVAGASVETSFDAPVPVHLLKKLYTRVYTNLENITTDQQEDIRETLTEGLAEGVNPRKVADRLTDRVDAVGMHRAEILARTETIWAYNSAALDRYERSGVTSVTVDVEWLSTDDNRTCPVCKQLDGNVYSIQEARTGTFEYEGREYRIRPPAHPQCRCSLAPAI